MKQWDNEGANAVRVRAKLLLMLKMVSALGACLNFSYGHFSSHYDPLRAPERPKNNLGSGAKTLNKKKC